MIGAVTNWDILAHPAVTIRSFGWIIFFKALLAGRNETFLALLRGANIFGRSTTAMPDLLERSVALEIQAKRIYEVLAKTFAQMRSANQFFEALARQEQDHADMLEICRAAAIRGGWKINYLNPWQGFLPRLEQQMQEAQASMHSITSLDDALRLVIQIESSEINQVFQAILAGSDSVFVKKMLPVQKTIEIHISYIEHILPKLSPHLMQTAKELRAKFFH